MSSDDTHIDDDFLSTLPIRQRAIINAIRDDLPGNAPKYLKASLDIYDHELGLHNTQPIIGLLKDMAAIIESGVGSSDAEQEWLPEGMHVAFERFAENHALFVRYFPLNPELERLYPNPRRGEQGLSGPALNVQFDKIGQAAAEANRAELTTDEFQKIVDELVEYAKVASTQDSHLMTSKSMRRRQSAAPNQRREKTAISANVLLGGWGIARAIAPMSRHLISISSVLFLLIALEKFTPIYFAASAGTFLSWVQSFVSTVR